MIIDKIKKNINLAPFTSFRIGGPAAFFVEINDKDDLPEALAWAEARQLPHFILAGGSNILISDAGFAGLVLRIKNSDISLEGNNLRTGAGARLSDAVAWAGEAGLAGLAWAAGIPGSIGGAIRGNAGAYGGEIKDALQTVEFFDLADKQFKTWPTADLAFNYRSSLFKDDKTKIIWQAVFALAPGDKETITKQAMDLIYTRAAKLPKYSSAGSVFKNLFPSDELVKALAAEDKVKGGKLAAAGVIESLGLKGKEIGGAKISDEHANCIVNYHQAKAADVLALIAEIKKAAKAKFNLDLEEEIELVGF